MTAADIALLAQLGQALGYAVTVVTQADIDLGISGVAVNAVIFDELEDAQMTKQKQKLPKRQQERRQVVLPAGKRMPVTVRDPLTRRVVKQR
jgi:hypothetical protein